MGPGPRRLQRDRGAEDVRAGPLSPRALRRAHAEAEERPGRVHGGAAARSSGSRLRARRDRQRPRAPHRGRGADAAPRARRLERPQRGRAHRRRGGGDGPRQARDRHRSGQARHRARARRPGGEAVPNHLHRRARASGARAAEGGGDRRGGPFGADPSPTAQAGAGHGRAQGHPRSVLRRGQRGHREPRGLRGDDWLEASVHRRGAGLVRGRGPRHRLRPPPSKRSRIAGGATRSPPSASRGWASPLSEPPPSSISRWGRTARARARAREAR